ncbi:cytoplasmic tRNA 2-thiolation protein 2 [Periophthalmus magnuspinnatus]|uniref:cytoplasmic tRNA 2-thiolation protein 2 n=1 Tax=Periophthalmus magnuspinnatus TaxID=409849 RepID=UPI0024371846|nr:cytoplasmic tRNA 2-thiolation protein 2 [Periophthalmus magnuspinnatus]
MIDVLLNLCFRVIFCRFLKRNLFVMCQVDEDYGRDIRSADFLSISKQCVKCKVHTPAVLLRVGDPYCRGCFHEYFIHKFRAMLGKNRIIFPGERVLLAVSGGPSSCSMLHQVQQGLSVNAHKKLRFTPGIVFIDEGALIGRSLEDRHKTNTNIRVLFESTGFPFHIVPLEQVLELPTLVLTRPHMSGSNSASSYKVAVGKFDQNKSCAIQPSCQQKEPVDVSKVHTVQLQQLVTSVKTHTAREELLNMLRQHLLLHMARIEGYSKLMLGDNCTRLAVKLLSNISLGRGSQTALDTGFSDSRYGDVIAVRPMRDYSAKEIAYYNHLFNVPYVFISGLDSKASDKDSIQRLTESFVTKLQTAFPSTVRTIYRTSEKLQTACKGPSAVEDSPRCVLCLCALDTFAENASAFQATLISEQLSQNNRPDDCLPTLKYDANKSAANCSGQCHEDGSCSLSLSKLEAVELKTLLCYSCQLTIKDMSSLKHLPSYIVSEAQRRLRRSQMRAEISNFLLDETA